MDAHSIWVLLFVLGVVAFCVGTLIPHRLIQTIGAIVAAVGGLGWFIDSLQ